ILPEKKRGSGGTVCPFRALFQKKGVLKQKTPRQLRGRSSGKSSTGLSRHKKGKGGLGRLTCGASLTGSTTSRGAAASGECCHTTSRRGRRSTTTSTSGTKTGLWSGFMTA